MADTAVYNKEMQIEDAIISWFKKADGRLKTFMEAITEDPEQCKSRKDIVSDLLWLEIGFMVDEVKDILNASDPKMFTGMEKEVEKES